MASSKAPFLSDVLFCEEEQWDKGDVSEKTRLECFIRQGVGDGCSHHSSSPEPFLELLGQNLWDGEELSCLLNKEKESGVSNGLEKNPCLAMARGEAVEWILEVAGYYSFSSLTAVLAVNYLDRFLYSFQSHSEKPWMTQLAAVACLSLAAKVEETEVPLLLDLQMEESKYESKTIERMEILVLSTLQWRMNPVTPLSFVDYVARRLPLDSNLFREFLRRCERLVLSLISDCRFMCYQPSLLAAATMLVVISSLDPCIELGHRDQFLRILGIKKDKVVDCCRLMKEVTTSIDFHSNNKRKFGSLPGSPKGVVDLSFSSDSSNESWQVASIASVTSSPEPLFKKIKSQSPNPAIF